MITQFKIFEDWDPYIFLDSEDKKSPEGYKYQIGDYVKVKYPTYYKWISAGFNSNSICIVCVVNKNPSQIGNNSYRYVVVPIEANNSDYEEWVTEDQIEPAPEHEVSAMKYNI